MAAIAARKEVSRVRQLGLWTPDANMNIPRGYEGDVVLTNGSVMTLEGSWSGGEGGKTAEVWTAESCWKVLSGEPETPIVGPDPQASIVAAVPAVGDISRVQEFFGTASVGQDRFAVSTRRGEL